MALQVLMVMLRVAIYTILERKFLSYMQLRKGPNKPGPLGLLIPFGDALKLVRKNVRTPAVRNNWIFMVVPCLSLFIPLLLWSLYPSIYEVLTYKYSIILFLCVSALGVYALLGAGWRRNRKYAMIGAIRAVAQSVSYEVSLSIIVLHCIMFYYYSAITTKSNSLDSFLFVIMALLFLSALAETNRSPFDFSEGESELVSGFNTEYSAVPFVMIFLAEYISILFMAALVRVLFNIKGYLDLYFFSILWAMSFIWMRGRLPRLRYDQLIYLSWKCLLPFVLSSIGLVLML